MTTEIQILAPASLSGATLAPDAAALKARLLTEAQAVEAVSDEFTASIGRDALKAISQALKIVEAQRVEITAPILAAQRAVKSVADEFSKPLTVEKDRLSRMIGGWEAQVRAAAEAELAKARAERDRIERERIDAQRKADELLRGQEFEPAPEAAAKAAAEAARLADEQTKAQIAVEAARPKSGGIGLRKSLAWEVVDAPALYAARPDLCDIVPKRAAINEFFKTSRELPGVRTWEETKAYDASR